MSVLFGGAQGKQVFIFLMLLEKLSLQTSTKSLLLVANTMFFFKERNTIMRDLLKCSLQCCSFNWAFSP